ncbi:hypothetical protein HOT99_gp139 [Caulobacter phage CcrBL10]|uniref:Uncharacterized protein n=1 Tax=Caulobacter phage CcrBL10 TaxID=2283269 RepID=A0A385ECL1_9CAUD|nr:hypothetical protein HOT99_gp139 [Caulobacter phage CcrBL10]AXQ68478.1 hypothetical protein CcrBL10_gp274 [Caulobacter phage CcrBL10]
MSARRKQTVIDKLDKTYKSIQAQQQRGVNWGTKACLELVDRYNDLKAQATRVGGHSNPEWKAYCERHGSSVAHDGYDLWA